MWAVETALQIDLRWYEHQRPYYQREEHPDDALADVVAVASMSERVPGAHPGEQQ
jgi:hypothetical protein